MLIRFCSVRFDTRGEIQAYLAGTEMLGKLVKPIRAEYKRLSQNQDYSGLAAQESVVLCLGKCSWTYTMLVANCYSCGCEDAGGVRNYSSLLILRELMAKVTKIIEEGSSGSDRTKNPLQPGSQPCKLTSISPDIPRDRASARLFRLHLRFRQSRVSRYPKNQRRQSIEIAADLTLGGLQSCLARIYFRSRKAFVNSQGAQTSQTTQPTKKNPLQLSFSEGVPPGFWKMFRLD